MVSDLFELLDDDFELAPFELSAPFKPFEQLLVLLHIASNSVLPPANRALMEQPTSQLAPFYPAHFEIDMNLSVSPWEGIPLLPFIDEGALKAAIATLPPSEAKQ